MNALKNKGFFVEVYLQNVFLCAFLCFFVPFCVSLCFFVSFCVSLCFCVVICVSLCRFVIICVSLCCVVFLCVLDIDLNQKTFVFKHSWLQV